MEEKYSNNIHKKVVRNTSSEREVQLRKNEIYQKAVTEGKSLVVAMTTSAAAAKRNWKNRKASPPRVPGIPSMSFILTMGAFAPSVVGGSSAGWTVAWLTFISPRCDASAHRLFPNRIVVFSSATAGIVDVSLSKPLILRYWRGSQGAICGNQIYDALLGIWRERRIEILSSKFATKKKNVRSGDGRSIRD